MSVDAMLRQMVMQSSLAHSRIVVASRQAVAAKQDPLFLGLATTTPAAVSLRMMLCRTPHFNELAQVT